MAYPFTLPRVNPETRYLLSARKRTTTGIVTMMDDAPYSPHSVDIFDSNDLSPSGRVHNADSCSICAATRYSDHAVMNEKSAVITSAGAARGRITL